MNGCNIGAWTNLATIEPETQERSYSTNAYLAPVTTRANLHVLTEAEVSEIIFERHSTTVSEDSPLVATGVRYRAEGEVYEATVSREIILCAGSIGSPQVLELSGIGNQQLLERAGVKAKFHNPNVGENLQDHIMTISVYELKDDTSAPAEQDLEKASIFLQEAEREYNESKTGYLTTTPSSMAYLPGSSFIPESKRARLAEVSQQTAEEITISTKAPKLNPRTGHHPAVAKILQRQFSLESRLGQLEYVLHYTNSSPFFKGQQERKYACLHQILQYPYSVGSIHVSATTNLTRNPVIDPKYYQDKGGAVDAEVMALGQEFGDKIMKTTPLSSIIKRRVWPPEDDQGGNKVDWSSWIRDNTVTDWHPIGTCALLPLTNGGVVNDQLRVYGTNNVRVVDASIIPLHISAHIQATVYAIAEKAADIILNGRRSI